MHQYIWFDCSQDFVSNNLGQRFIEPQTADLSVSFKESSPTTPLVFVLSTGTDPAADLYKFAEEMRFSKKLTSISLGQGQVSRRKNIIVIWWFYQSFRKLCISVLPFAIYSLYPNDDHSFSKQKVHKGNMCCDLAESVGSWEHWLWDSQTKEWISFVFFCFANPSIVHNFGTTGPIQVGFSAKCTSRNEQFN